MKTKILLTGGGGYIGSVLAQHLVKRNYQLRIVDLFWWGLKPLSVIKDKVEIIKTDIRLVDNKIFKDVDTVIHLAGLSNDPMAEFNPKLNYEINTEATKKLVILAKENGVKKFLFASSASIYHRQKRLNTIKTERSKIRPTLPYSRSKYLAEKAVLKSADKNFSPVVFRLGTVFGFSPRMRYDLVVNTMVKTALDQGKIFVFDGGKEWRPLVEINDVAECFIRAINLDIKKIKAQIFNLCYDNFKIIEVAKKVKKTLEKITNKKITLVFSESDRPLRSYKMSVSKLQRVFNWRPKITIEESVGEIFRKIERYKFNDFDNPRYNNIQSMKLFTVNFKK